MHEVMEYGLLGSLLVRRAGLAVPIEGGKQRALLAALLLRAGRLTEVDELVEVLWDARPPQSPRASLQSQVARLRGVLGVGSAWPIVTEPGGYLIRVGPGELDVERFEASIEAGREAAAAGDWTRSADVLRGGLALWRGEPLAGVTSDVLASREIPRLNELRLQAREARIDADLHLGRYREVIAELRQLAAAEPLRERVHALLMTALYRDGQQAGALSAYQAARRALVEQLGVEPGADLQDLHQQVLAGEVPGARSLSPGSPAELMRFSLPPDVASFTGRQPELDEITGAARASAAASCVISGMPGVGKTALAVHAAHRLRDRYPDRQLFVDLHGFTPGRAPVAPEEALAELLTAAGTSPRYLPPGLAGRAAMWRDKMTGQHAVLVLDNAISSAQVAPLLPGAPGCLVLVTSRRHLADLPGSALPVLLEVLTPDQAHEMFTRMVPRAGAAAAGAVAEVMELAGYLPLAVSLLARAYARHPSWGLADLAAETRARMLTLTAEQDSVAAAFAVSLRHQDTPARELFARLGLYPGDTFDAYAAAALAGTTLAQAGSVLDGLHTEGLVMEASYRRYELHDLVRRYAADQAGNLPATAQDQAMERLLDYYQRGAARAQSLLVRRTAADQGGARAAPPDLVPDIDDSRRALAWARAERATLLACLDYVTRSGQRARLVALTAALADLLRRDGRWAEAMSRHAAAARAAREIGDAAGQAGALQHLGDARRMTGDLEGAVAVLGEALALYRDSGDRYGLAQALESLGSARRLMADYPGAAGLLEEARAVFGGIGDHLGEARNLHLLATLRLDTGDAAAAIGLLERARALFGTADDHLGLANTLHLHGMLLLDTGDYPQAAELLTRARASYVEIDYRNGIANSLHGLSSVRRATGDRAGAAELLTEALAIFRELGSRLGQAHTLGHLGALRRELGDPAGAQNMLAEALASYRSMSNRQGEAETLTELARLHQDRGDFGQARNCLVRALELAREIGSSRDEASARASLEAIDSLRSMKA